MQPTSDMMAPIDVLARFIATGEEPGLAAAFTTEGVVIVENFAPFLFEGADAFVRWRAGFHDHVDRDGLSELKHSFGQAQDFARDGDRVFFILPTTWAGRSHGRPRWWAG